MSEASEAAARLSWLDKHRPREQYPFECSAVPKCEHRANSAWDVIAHGVRLHFCSKEHMLKVWSKPEVPKRPPGRPRGSKNKRFIA